MLALGADRVMLRQGVVLNPHYQTMGLYGSEYWTYVLPRRAGEAQAESLTQQCLPIGWRQAAQLGLADVVLGGSTAQFEVATMAYAARLAARKDFAAVMEAKAASRAADEQRRPLEAYRIQELAEMSRDIFDDRHGFADARHGFVTKRKALSTPARIALHRPAAMPTAGPAPAAGLAS
jgi:putative two-component system hydrogenase maturation factor HypX/HoxX